MPEILIYITSKMRYRPAPTRTVPAMLNSRRYESVNITNASHVLSSDRLAKLNLFCTSLLKKKIVEINVILLFILSCVFDVLVAATKTKILMVF